MGGMESLSSLKFILRLNGVLNLMLVDTKFVDHVNLWHFRSLIIYNTYLLPMEENKRVKNPIVWLENEIL